MTLFSRLLGRRRLQHRLTRWAGRLGDCRWPWFVRGAIHLFVWLYNVNVEECEHSDLAKYACFNDFFARQPRPDVRSWQGEGDDLCFPCDGAILAAAPLGESRLLRVKGQDLSALDLVGGKQELLEGASGFVTIYLAPSDFHRVYAPTRLRLRECCHLPGALFPVRPQYLEEVENLFVRNERLTLAGSCDFGPITLVMVGAMLVGSIRPSWEEAALPHPKPGEPYVHRFPGAGREFAPGEELASFLYGSTVILLLPSAAMEGIDCAELQQRGTARIGELLGAPRRPAQAPDERALD